MGLTTGPWESKPDRNDPKPSAYGHFVTVWKKQPDGSWKWVVDLGISHPQSGGPQTLWQPADKTTDTKPANVDVASATKGLLDRDRILSVASLDEGLSKAFVAYASPEVRLYRAGNLPYIGRDASAAALAKIQGQFKSLPIGGDVARAGDLGYTHGTYELADVNQKVIERGSYVRIWKKQSGRWQVVLDVTNAH
jgi:ketosteroid isomerase-like protein